MRGSEEHIDELIERYILGQMSEEERRGFEKELQIDPLLQELVSESQMLKDVIRSENDINAFHDTLKTVIQEKRPSPNSWRWWGVAAALVLCFSAILWMKQVDPSGNPSELATAYFEPYPDVITSRDQGDSLVSQAMTAYGAQDYMRTIAILESMEVDRIPLFSFYLGVSFQATEQYERALDVWMRLENTGERALKYDIQWYKALALLGLNETEMARKVLEELAGQSSSVQTKARELLKEI